MGERSGRQGRIWEGIFLKDALPRNIASQQQQNSRHKDIIARERDYPTRARNTYFTMSFLSRKLSSEGVGAKSTNGGDEDDDEGSRSECWSRCCDLRSECCL